MIMQARAASPVSAPLAIAVNRGRPIAGCPDWSSDRNSVGSVIAPTTQLEIPRISPTRAGQRMAARKFTARNLEDRSAVGMGTAGSALNLVPPETPVRRIAHETVTELKSRFLPQPGYRWGCLLAHSDHRLRAGRSDHETGAGDISRPLIARIDTTHGVHRTFRGCRRGCRPRGMRGRRGRSSHGS